MLTSETVLSQILDENIIDAKKSIHALLAQKAKVYLEDKRRCIAAVTYGPCATAEAKGDCNCSCDEQVAEDCGCSEVEEMNANQKKLDKNHNGKLDGQDFKILRGKKKKQVESVEELRAILDEASDDTDIDMTQADFQTMIRSAYNKAYELCKQGKDISKYKATITAQIESTEIENTDIREGILSDIIQNVKDMFKGGSSGGPRYVMTIGDAKKMITTATQRGCDEGKKAMKRK